MAGCWSTFTSELSSLKVLGKIVGNMCGEPHVYEKVSFTQFMKMNAGFVHEVVTNPKQSCEEVAEVCCGKGQLNALNGKVAIVTGASNGLGLETARVLMKYGCHVIWAVRSPAKAQKALEDIEAKEGKLTGKATVLKVELSDLTTIKPFVDNFLKLNLPLHHLILNAGIMGSPEWEASAQGYEIGFATNNLGHFLMTELLLPKLEDTAKTLEARVVILSSATAALCRDIDVSKLPAPKEEYNDFADYAVTKACDAFHARSMQKKYKGTNIQVMCLHPGIIGTGIMDHHPSFGKLFFGSMTFAPFRRDIPGGAATTMYCILSPDIPAQVKQGSFYYYNCAPQQIRGVCAPGRADHLMDELEELQKRLVKPYMV